MNLTQKYIAEIKIHTKERTEIKCIITKKITSISIDKFKECKIFADNCDIMKL